MFFWRSVWEVVPPLLSVIFATRQFFFFSFSSRPLLLRLRALRDVVLFLMRGAGGDWDVDREGDWRLYHLSFSFCFCCPLLGTCSLLSEVVAAWALSSSLSDQYDGGAGCCCTQCWSLVIPWLTISSNSPVALSFHWSCAASDVASILKFLRMDSTSWTWLYLYLATILRWATLISAPHICCAAHSVLAKITTARRLLCTRTP